uniref:Uncharacterized protein n=1 Tax=Acrobeloides nanus TaxID=290746 RepID=A0A914CT99_9BILA
MKAFFAICLALYIGFCAAQTTPPACPAAGITQISTCYAAYFKNLNFTSTPPFMTYVQAIDKLIIQGVSSFKTMCTWSTTRQTCIGMYDPMCATGAAFQQALGVSTKNEAYEYLSAYGTNNWECGPGYSDVVANFYCLENVGLNHKSDILTCYSAYNASIQQNGFSCSALATYTTCYANVYKKYCGAIGGYIGCSLVKAGALEDVPYCADQLPICSKNFEAHKLFGMRHKLAAKRLAQKNHNNGDASKIH